MWDSFLSAVRSSEFWGALGYLVIGTIVGAVVSVRYSLRANRPKLIVGGGGGGGSAHQRSCNITIANRPSFLGQPLDGEAARDVRGWIRVRNARQQTYPVVWGPEREYRVTIEAGQSNPLVLFHWKSGRSGFFVVDGNGEPVAAFQSGEHEFVVTLRDRLGRDTEFPFTVDYDDTNLKNPPRLRIRHPIQIRHRLDSMRAGIRKFLYAFRRS